MKGYTRIYVQFSDDGQHIRRWATEPFDGGVAYDLADEWIAVPYLVE